MWQKCCILCDMHDYLIQIYLHTEMQMFYFTVSMSIRTKGYCKPWIHFRIMQTWMKYEFVVEFIAINRSIHKINSNFETFNLTCYRLYWSLKYTYSISFLCDTRLNIHIGYVSTCYIITSVEEWKIYRPMFLSEPRRIIKTTLLLFPIMLS